MGPRFDFLERGLFCTLRSSASIYAHLPNRERMVNVLFLT
jgi:hypothetical protein